MDSNQLLSALINFIANRTVHKLAGTALASYGLVITNHLDAILGVVYAAAMHLTGGLKKVAD